MHHGQRADISGEATPSVKDPVVPPSMDWTQLTQLAVHLARMSAALLVQVGPGGPVVLGVSGLPADQQAGAAALCARVAADKALHGRLLDTADGHVWAAQPLANLRHCLVLPLPPSGHQGTTWLALLDPMPRSPSELEGFLPGVQALIDHAGHLQDLALQQQRSAHLTQGREESLGKALHESESRLNLTEHTAGVGTWSVNTTSGQVQHSDEYGSILGLQAGESVHDLAGMVRRYKPELRKVIHERLEQCAQTGEAFDEELQVLVPGTGTKWVRTVGNAVRNGEGQILRIQGAVQDITVQKQAQQETMRLAMRLTTTLASIKEAFVTLDRQCCFTYLNQESERLLQKTTAELLGQEIWQDFNTVLAQRLRVQLGHALKTNRQVELEDFFPLIGKWLEVRAYPFTEGLAVYFRDVTERRRSQEHQMLLETSVARLNDIVAIAEAGSGPDDEPRMVFVNDAFEKKTGYNREEVLGKSPRMLLELDPAKLKLLEMAKGLQQTRQARTELKVFRKTGTPFWVELEVVSVQASADEVTHWVAVGRDITHRKGAEEMIRHLAFYDPLTDLPNRQLLLDRLQKALSQSARTGQHGALMFIDLDNFKILNDTLGHHVGDQLLQQVAQRLKKSVRKTDTVARLGGDEFVVMVDDLSTDPDAAASKSRALSEKVLTMLREPFRIAGHQHFATPSIGVTTFSGNQSDVSELLKQADLAMYQAKALGRNTLCYFAPDMLATVTANAAVGIALREGLREKQFVVHYQPQVNLQGLVTGVEALVRWNHPEKGLVMPAAFIPVAEDTGLILPLGMWVLETACEQLVAWADSAETANLSIAVNVSAYQFRHPNFVDMVMSAIKRTGIRPQGLKLELTESLLADRMEITIQKMGMLKDLGVTLALDDFGVGYSSLSCLKRLPLDQLKIDKDFVADVLTDPNDAAISRAIIALAQSLNLQVVAEGVETQEQRDFLANQGCDQFQGYLFAPALPLEALELLLRKPLADTTVTG
ncbi:sensor domain-containing protein [Hydrogenophaga crassostreae]|uniref:sensor domain-containing protein n=1 Tax=Hydrogenophaga crassostreae TaxID=1763535 RepID=UPI0009EE98D8|nr:bifunctional diguanylate cyclase/phosphodiesterase [Hydrogenophaga crassostreae]